MEILKNLLSKDHAVLIINEETNCSMSYDNSIRGRVQLEMECSPDIVVEVYKVWGNTPTVTEPTYPTIPVSTSPTINERVVALEAATLSLVTGG